MSDTQLANTPLGDSQSDPVDQWEAIFNWLSDEGLLDWVTVERGLNE